MFIEFIYDFTRKWLEVHPKYRDNHIIINNTDNDDRDIRHIVADSTTLDIVWPAILMANYFQVKVVFLSAAANLEICILPEYPILQAPAVWILVERQQFYALLAGRPKNTGGEAAQKVLMDI